MRQPVDGKMETAPSAQRVRLGLIALPTEHGGWGLLGAPILLGLWVAPTVAGGWLSLAALGAFLSHQPLKLALADLRRGKRYPRTPWAVAFTLFYGCAALLGLILATLTAQHAFWPPLLLAAPLAFVQLWYDMRNKGRTLMPELCGALALGSLAAALALVAGWSWALALALWLVLAAQAGSAIVYVTTRLRLERGKPASPMLTWLAHAVALLLVGGLVSAGLVSWLVLVAFVALTARAGWGLSPYRRPTRTAIIGVQELAWSMLTVACVAIGF
ncbi:MAG: YwiC-like family protein [Chloroflexaceae bacterium]|jgi:hypothetical protein|nr:YwiC-like family protein [Chloroflexaceae bacterium]